jgi:hypothetical protein
LKLLDNLPHILETDIQFVGDVCHGVLAITALYDLEEAEVAFGI